jgi:protein-ribulosamine 3-kinase
VTVPSALRAQIDAWIEADAGRRDPIVRSSPVGGGCVSPTAHLETAGGRSFFLKWGGADLPGGMLSAEAAGLRSLAAAGAVRVPQVLASGECGRYRWLLLEWLETGLPTVQSWTMLGTALAVLHRQRERRFGADADNFIGPIPQYNEWTASWPRFWRHQRLEPQLAAARSAGLLDETDGRRFESLFARLDDLLALGDEDGPSLLHGDLWIGNVHFTPGGIPALVDPSVYYGHREVDLAMAALFGGFRQPFHQAYGESWPLARGYEPVRRSVYQLYYLLVHVNLFGGGYVARTRAALTEAGT